MRSAIVTEMRGEPASASSTCYVINSVRALKALCRPAIACSISARRGRRGGTSFEGLSRRSSRSLSRVYGGESYSIHRLILSLFRQGGGALPGEVLGGFGALEEFYG